jgi:hypothetical protein
MEIGFDGGYFATKAQIGDRVAYFESFAVKPSESLFSLNGHQTIIVSFQHGRYLVGLKP